MPTEQVRLRAGKADPRHGARRMLAMVIALALLPSTVLPTVSASSTASENHRTIDPADYELAWQAFLGARELADAVALANKALREQPDSLLWHRRLASVAEQSGNAMLAADQFAWLVTQGRQVDLLAHAIDLSNATQQNDMAIRLMLARAAQEPFNQEHWDQLLASMLDIGRFDQALTVLAAADRLQPRRYFLLQQAQVLALAGRPDDRARKLQAIIARYGADPQTNLQLAAAQYLRGDLHQALATLRQAIPAATAGDTLYWQTLGSLAWMLQDFPSAALASRNLLDSGQAKPADYARLYRLHASRDPAVAYAYAVTGWRSTHDESLFFEAIAAATQLKQPALLRGLFAGLRADERQSLRSQPQFWIQWAHLAHLDGDDQRALARYREALRLAPHDADVFAGFLWLLIDSRDNGQLRALTDRYGAVPPADQGIREALTAALSLLDQPGRALALMRSDPGGRHDDPEWLSQYADLLDQTDQAELAHAMRRAAVAPLRRAIAAANPDLAQRLQDKMLGLTTQLAPGDPSRRAIAPLLQHTQDAAARERVLSWTTTLDSPEATSLWLAQHYRDGSAPLWARLSQSLATDDDQATMQLLLANADRLPRRDRVTAAEKIGWKADAVTMAYEGLQREPDDRQLAMQYQRLAIAQADTLTTSASGLRSGGLRAIDSGIDGRSWLAHAFSLDTELHRVQQSGYDTRLLAGIPGYAQYASATLTEQLPRGERGISLGGGSNFAGYAQAGAFYRYRVRQMLELAVSLDYGARADESVPLTLAGLVDRVRATASYPWTPWDSVSGTATVGHLRAQGGGSLGERQSIDLEYRHKLWLAPPDFTLVASVNDARFQRAASLPSQLRRLLPVGQPATTAFFVPRSYTQACVGGAFNENYRADWSGQWRAFGNASVCRNSVSGGGFALDVGFATPVIGSDHLGLSLGYSSNTGPTGSRNVNLMLNYRYYFTP